MDSNQIRTFAFPSNNPMQYHSGMTLRDYFAAKALPNLIQNPRFSTVDGAACEAYKIADAMIEARQIET